MKNQLNYNLNPAFAHLSLTIKPSCWLLLFFLLLGCIAIACIWITIPHTLVAMILIVVIATVTLHAILLHALLVLPKSVVNIYTDNNQHWFISNRAGQTCRINFHGSTFVSSFCSVVNCYMLAQTRWQFMTTVVLHPSRVEKESYRKFRIILRLVYSTEHH